MGSKKDLFHLHLVDILSEYNNDIIVNKYNQKFDGDNYNSSNYEIVLDKYCNDLNSNYLVYDKKIEFDLFFDKMNIGSIIYKSDYSGKNLELIYGIKEYFKSNSIMPKFLDETLNLIENNLEINNIVVNILKSNLSSIRVLEKSSYDFIFKKDFLNSYNKYYLNLGKN